MSIKPPTLLSSLRIRQFTKALCTFRSSLRKFPTMTGIRGTETPPSSPVASASKVLGRALLVNEDNASCVARVAVVAEGEADDTRSGLALQAACRYQSRMREMMEAYSIDMCDERAHGHSSSCPRGPTTSPVRVRTELRSSVRAGRPSEMGADGLAQYSRRIMSLASWVQSCRSGGGGDGGCGAVNGVVDSDVDADPDDFDADVDNVAGISTGSSAEPFCLLVKASQSDELGGSESRLLNVSYGNQV